MRRLTIRLAAALIGGLVGCAATGAALAQDLDWSACNNGQDHDASISGCTRVLDRGNREPPARQAVAHRNRADAYYRKSETDLAIRDADEAIRLDPKLGAAYNTRGHAYLAKRDFDRAIQNYDEAIRLNPKSAAFHSNRGFAFTRKENYDRALEDLNEAIRLDPKFAVAYSNRARVFIGKEDYDRAIAEANVAIRLNPKLAGGYDSRAMALNHQGDYDRAVADWNEAIQREPNSAAAYSGRGASYALKGDFDGAIRDLDEAIRRDPSFTSAYDSRGFAYLQKGDLERAFADLNEAIRLDPKNVAAYRNRGDAYRQKGDLGRAFADLNEALRLDPKNMPAYAFRGLAFERKGDRESAIADFKLALSLPAGRFWGSGLWARAAAKERLAALTAAPPAVVQNTAAAAKLPLPPPAAALGRRVALVIGNSAYQSVAALPNPTSDARAMADVLKGAGFADVWLVTDATHEAMLKALRSFQDEADKADWALIYFAGHGLEIGGTNYLVPTDARLKIDRDVQDEAVSLNRVLDAIAAARKVKLVLLDACRDNPFAQQMRRTMATRAVSRGLVRIDPEGRTMVVYAAKDGEVADDGNTDHSPFTAALIHRLQQPGLEINRLFGLVTGDVMLATGNHQRPYVYGSIPLIEGEPDDVFRVQ